MSNRWLEIAWHPNGYVLSNCTEGLRAPWASLRLAHPDWAGHRKRDRFVWLKWNTSKQRLFGASQSTTTTQFALDRPDVFDWVAQVMVARAGGNPDNPDTGESRVRV
jgi:hypothetical protein